jgi:hypothetical protein
MKDHTIIELYDITIFQLQIIQDEYIQLTRKGCEGTNDGLSKVHLFKGAKENKKFQP